MATKAVNGFNSTAAVSWSGLKADTRYLGAVQFLDPSLAVHATTAVRIETGVAGIPAAQGIRGEPKEAVQEQ